MNMDLSKNGTSKKPSASLDVSKSKPKKEKKARVKSPKQPKKPLDPKVRRKRVIFGGIAVALIAAGAGLFVLYKTNNSLSLMGIKTNPSATIGNIITQKEPELEKDFQNRTNSLLVGIDTRPSNPGLRNTDTIIVSSYNHDTNEVVMISIPRDTWVEYPTMPGYFTKINGIYNHCEANEEGTGMDCIVEVAETVTNLDIQYYGMVDISGLVEVIDLIGGVEVDVENAFTDYMFPTPENTWETISFEAGVQHMDGETAMKYARSRHAQSTEGSDFARARRQQRLILAVKDKILTMETFQNPLTVVEIAEQLGSSIKLSDITTEDIRAAIALGDKVEETENYALVLDPSIANWELITEDPSAAYVLVPRSGAGQWDDIHEFIGKVLENPALYTDGSRIYVYNGGLGYNETYLAYEEFITAYPYLTITFGGNTSLQDYTGNSVYSFDEESSQTALDEVATYFQSEWSREAPEGLSNIYGEEIVVIMGTPIPEEVTPQGEADTSGSTTETNNRIHDYSLSR